MPHQSVLPVDQGYEKNRIDKKENENWVQHSKMACEKKRHHLGNNGWHSLNGMLMPLNAKYLAINWLGK